MDAQQFAYWLQGFAELNEGGSPPTGAQWQMIREHLATVFTKVTPQMLSRDVLDLAKMRVGTPLRF